MKHPLVFVVATLALSICALAQDATPTPKPHKTMTFTPGPATPKPRPKATPAAAAATPAEKAAAAPPVAAPEFPASAPSPAIVTSTVPPEPAQIVRAFFALLGKGDIENAYAGLMKGSRIAERPGEVAQLKAKTKEAIDVFGVIHGYDLVDNKPVSERLMRATYLSLGHDLPLRWRFYFYKSEEVWKLIDLRVDDKLTGIFDEQPEELPATSEAHP